jgi:hypothetical protein
MARWFIAGVAALFLATGAAHAKELHHEETATRQRACDEPEPPRGLVHSISIRDLPRGEAERRADAADAPDAGDEAERLKVGDRRHHGLPAAHGEVRQAFEAGEYPAVFLRESNAVPLASLDSQPVVQALAVDFGLS